MNDSHSKEASFISQLFKKKADMLTIQARTRKPMASLMNEVDRQIQQALHGGNPIRGTGVTKSGNED